ncbi:MAG: DUF4136 domain-containing protein [Thermoanaerobaculales bacterium]|jgi:hypothetical protein|nr:DUF4136 domain-containing protein [Thermoanaerobaculales bacterium]
MKRALGIAIALGLAATPALAQKVTIDYAHDFSFADVKTFSYVDNEESKAQNPMMHDRIVSMIKARLIAGGLTEATADPDVYITYHLTTEEQTTYSTTSFGYGGYWGGWGGWGYGPSMASSTTMAHNYVEGTLIFDLYDAAEKKMVWRGTGTVTVKDAPEKQVKQVESIIEKLGKKWHKIIAGKGK